VNKGKLTMVQTANQRITIQELKSKLMAIYEYLTIKNDNENREKVRQLARKLENREFMIAFCGHFSAGKSTMINHVVGENLLPSSPIPTSANLVRVKSGEEYAKVYFKNEKPRLYLAPYDYELVKKYCKDGDQIEEIEISHSHSSLPQSTVIMDTPGIDSADDAHRIATESAIHLADLVLYVMDYNHVQAELNFLFTKELTEAGKEVYLVINQVDKHKEEELPFDKFKESVEESFGAWGVNPARIFYTSLKVKDHKLSEYNELKHFISEKLLTKDEVLQQSIFHSLKKIAQDHLDETREVREEQLLPFYEIVEELSEAERDSLTESYQQIKSTLQTLEKGTEESKKEMELEVEKILKSAYLMPFQTRELAESYLEACQPEFKVGFIFTKQKTQDERNARLDRFYQDLVEKTKSQLEWHIREYLHTELKKHDIHEQELQANAQSFTIEFPIDLLSKTVKQGARLSGEYVLHYTEDLANEIKRIARNELVQFKHDFESALDKKNTLLKEKYDEQYQTSKRYILALDEISKFEGENLRNMLTVTDLLTKGGSNLGDTAHIFELEDEEVEVVNGTEKQAAEVLAGTGSPTRHDSVIKDKNVRELVNNDHLPNMVKKLEETSLLIKNLPGFKKLSIELAEKADRLAHKGFTVALFGAFSAGKSSFANALMGDKVLPVSPNPTTAAINKIRPVTDQYPHGTVLVKFKEESAMLEDVNRSLKLFEMQTVNLKGATNDIDRVMLEQGQVGVSEKTHYAFLQAFKNGYTAYGSQLGKVLETDLKEFKEFVAREERSCFVEWIELYYDCELTRKGVTLVDTPGADSINARHTGVAFDYIKNSDAILFVTYYNHAFSKADREFLIQLGRVKDSFQLDKMFFIINAIDLAENNEEKDTVITYVNEQLIKYGIRNPNLFPLSSLQALSEKIEPLADLNSGMKSFEHHFNHFIANDLTEMAVKAADSEFIRVHELVERLLRSSREDQTEKDKRRVEMDKQKKSIQLLLKEQSEAGIQKRVTQEVEELLFYMRQRVFFRFGDFFKEAFNPSVLRDDGRNLKKALQSCLDEFLDSLGFDFAQEMRAATLRIERFAEKGLRDSQHNLCQSLRNINEDLSFSSFEMMILEELEFKKAFEELNSRVFSKALSYFKNPKSFFEKNDKKAMSDELNHVLQAPADEYLKQERDRIVTHYEVILTREFSRLIRQIEEQVEDFYLSLESALDGGVSIDELIEIDHELGNITIKYQG
jgi:GTPase Era involved in 16S rRNA processing